MPRTSRPLRRIPPIPTRNAESIFALIDEYEDDDGAPTSPVGLQNHENIPPTAPLLVVDLEGSTSAEDALGQRKMKKAKLMDESTPSENESVAYLKCIVCMEATSDEKGHLPHTLSCGHIFGERCINTWMKGMPSLCPTCKAHAFPEEVKRVYPTSARDEVLEDALQRADEADAYKERTDARIANLVEMNHMLVNTVKRLSDELHAVHNRRGNA